MNNNGIVRYDLQQGQQSVVQAHPEEPKEPGIGSRLFSAFAQEAPKLMETGLKAYETYDKNQKEQQKATNQAEFYKMSVELKDQIDATKMQPAEVRAGIDKLYTTGLSMGLSYADIGNAFAGSGIDTNQKFIKDLMQSEVDVQRDNQKAFADAAAAVFSYEKDPVRQQELLSMALITEENIKTLKSAAKEIDPNSQLDFTKANFNVAMTSYVNSAYANAYSQLQNRFNTNNVIQVSQVVRQQLAEQGFSPAAVEYYVRNREMVWKRIAETNETNTEAAQKAVANDTQLFLDTSLQSLLQQEIAVGKDTYQLGTAIAVAKAVPEVGKTIFENAQLKDPFFKAVMSGSKIELPRTLDASAIKLTLGANSMLTQNIQDTGSEPLKDLSEAALKTFLKGQSGEGSSKSAAGLSMAAYRNATGNLQKKDFAGREDTEADTFSHASKAISSDIEAINPGKDYVMLFDDDGTPRLYQTHLEKQLEISENMAYALEPGFAVPQYIGGKRGYAFEDVSNESFFTREYAGSAVQFLQDAATRTGKSKKELIYEFNSSMMKNSKAAKDLYKYLTDKDTAPTDDWVTAKVAEARKGENKNLSQIISEENVERALEENPYTNGANIRQLGDLPEDSEDAVITTDTADFVVPSVEESGSIETSSALENTQDPILDSYIRAEAGSETYEDTPPNIYQTRRVKNGEEFFRIHDSVGHPTIAGMDLITGDVKLFKKYGLPVEKLKEAYNNAVTEVKRINEEKEKKGEKPTENIDKYLAKNLIEVDGPTVRKALNLVIRDTREYVDSRMQEYLKMKNTSEADFKKYYKTFKANKDLENALVIAKMNGALEVTWGDQTMLNRAAKYIKTGDKKYLYKIKKQVSEMKTLQKRSDIAEYLGNMK